MDLSSLTTQLTQLDWVRFASAFALAAILVLWSIPWAQRWGLVDHPGGRKQHEGSTPVTGGLCIMVAIFIAGLAFDPIPGPRLMVFFACACVLVAVGVLDDLRDLNWKLRIGAQILVALAMMQWAGLSVARLDDVFGIPHVHIGWLAVPFTIFVVVGVINALNMADGVDGLAGGQALVSLVLLGGFALYSGDALASERLLTVAAAVAGFLLWNLRFPWQSKARAFLGNAGSMLIGFVIAWYAIRLGQNPAHPVSPVLGPWTIALPLIDCVTLMFRRLTQGRSPFNADRDHLHHLLLDAGYTPTGIAVGLAGVSLLLGIGAAVAIKVGIYRPLLVVAFLGLLAAYYALTVERGRAVRLFRALHPRLRSLPQTA